MNSDKNIKTAVTLAFVAVFMFGFGYAMVPLYDVFCETLGLNGKTGEISAANAALARADLDRSVIVEFDTNISSSLRWNFRPETRKMTVHPGKLYEALFYAENLTGEPVAGQAVPSVAPSIASLYFNKTECFCFTRQTLGPYENRHMPVKFMVDPALPGHVRILTLSYTFFQSPDTAGGSYEADPD